jgi:hypothetical protein
LNDLSYWNITTTTTTTTTRRSFAAFIGAEALS